MSNRKQFRLEKPPAITTIVQWCAAFEKSLLLHSNSEHTGQKDPYGKYDLVAAAGVLTDLPTGTDPFRCLFDFHNESQDWIFGHLCYELNSQSVKPDRIGFPLMGFFVPRYVLTINSNEATIHYQEKHESDGSLQNIIRKLTDAANHAAYRSEKKTLLRLSHRTPYPSYREKAQQLLEHIQRGDIYEVNLCIESYIENCRIDPAETFLALQDFSPMPFSAFYRFFDKYLMCSSPERYLAKRGCKLISQPIKGTIRRGVNAEEDTLLKVKLTNDPKEQAENIMITDLVRNDLSRVASRGTVKVEELMALKTFPRIHQLISTISCELEQATPWSEAIRNSFPMGSMTGAPKLRAMQLIDEFEDSNRGLYSGCVGYVTPYGDFDFNVVIRSLQYNALRGYLSMMAGSALTMGCDPEKEYAECQLKAETMMRALD